MISEMIKIIQPEFVLIGVIINIIAVEVCKYPIKRFTKNDFKFSDWLLRCVVFVMGFLFAFMNHMFSFYATELHYIYEGFIISTIAIVIWHMGVWKVIDFIKSKVNINIKPSSF